MHDSTLMLAYRQTAYVVPELDLTIRIDTRNRQLDEVLEKYQVSSWAFLTAINPHSIILPAIENQQRLARLTEACRGWQCFSATGVPDSSDWQPEASVFVLGISRDVATRLGLYYEQNAIVFGQKYRCAELLPCKIVR